MVDIQLMTLIATVLLALVGYLITYWNNLQLSKRRDRLDLINKKINDFYGPLYIACEAGNMAYKSFLQRLNREKIYDSDLPLSESELDEWRLWLQEVFMPLNLFREELILDNAYLIQEQEMPECLLEFLTHVSTYKVITAKWTQDDFSETILVIDFPFELNDYARKSYERLKTEQLDLIGKAKPDL